MRFIYFCVIIFFFLPRLVTDWKYKLRMFFSLFSLSLFLETLWHARLKRWRHQEGDLCEPKTVSVARPTSNNELWKKKEVDFYLANVLRAPKAEWKQARKRQLKIEKKNNSISSIRKSNDERMLSILPETWLSPQDRIEKLSRKLARIDSFEEWSLTTARAPSITSLIERGFFYTGKKTKRRSIYIISITCRISCGDTMFPLFATNR